MLQASVLSRGLMSVLALCVLLSIAEAGAAQPSDTVYDKFRTFQTILRLVRNNYVDEVDTAELIDGAIAGLLAELDPHSDYIDPERYAKMNERNRGEYHGIGISFAIRNGYLTVISPIEGSPAHRLGMRAGDRIVKIEGESAIGITESEVFEKLRGPKGSRVNVAVSRPGRDELIDFEIVRDTIPIKSVPYWFMLTENLGYVRLIRFSATTGDELEQALQDLEQAGMQKLLLDLRGNAGGYLEQAIEVSDKFIDGGKMIVYTKGRIPGSSEEHHSSGVNTHPAYPVVVLIDHGSASASEIVSGAVQDWDRGIVVGQTSFGKGLVQRQYRLNDGSALFLTVARYYTPSGRLIQRDFVPGDKMSYYAEGYDDDDPNARLTTDADEPTGAQADTTDAGRPVYYTAGGRVVYGGGGITPDFFLEPVELTPAQQTLEQSQLFFEFANEWVGQHDFTYSDFESFRTEFVVDDDIWTEFTSKAAAMELELSHEEVEAEREYASRGIRREIAGNLWGAQARYRVLVEGDAMVASAMTYVDEAEELLHGQHAMDRTRN